MKTINLALQGGGAHGAFTWGVLDALAEDARIDIDGITATSAGAMNAAVYAYGFYKGGYDGVREALAKFWEDISKAGSIYSPVRVNAWERFLCGTDFVGRNFSYKWFDNFTRLFSPYEFNPLNINPLREVLESNICFADMPKCIQTKLFISATNVRTNKIKIFHNEDLSADALLASACLPMLFQAVEIDGEAYWDGGYMGNPALYPLIYETQTEDIVMVPINPTEREDVPITSDEIYNRVNEISFNSSLLRELRAIDFAKRLVEEHWIKDEYQKHFRFHHLYLHSIRADDMAGKLSIASKFSPDWQFLCSLRDHGREMTQRWLEEHYDDLGQQSTFDLRAQFE